MPELPEVETVMNGMGPVIIGQTVAQVILNRAGLRVPFPANMDERLTGASVIKCRRRAKYILADFSNGTTMIMHLGMSGRILLTKPHDNYELQKHDHMEIVFKNGTRMVYNDPRRFGMVCLCETDDVAQHKSLVKLGPEPLDPPLTGAVLLQKFQGKKSNIKSALLDQRVVAGLGNIYVCEALFISRINPERRACDINKAEAGTLAKAICDVLRLAIEKGGSTLKDYRHTDGSLGYFQHNFKVYDRQGEACEGCNCDVSKTGGIARIVQAGRSTFFCAKKQK